MTERLELERKAEILVRNARAALIMSRPFYGVLVSQVTPKMSWGFPTAATNSVTHFFNPKFVSELTPAKVKGTQAHETEHDARHHATRRGNRDPRMWNEACDYEINPDLIDEGFELPDGFLYREDFRGLVAEEIYRVLQKEKAQKQQEEEEKRRKQQEQSKDDESEDGDGGKGEAEDNEAEDNEAGEEAGNEGESEDEDGEESSDKSDGDGKADEGKDDADKGDGDSGEEADGEEADGDGGSGDDTDEDGDDEGDGTGDGEEADDGDGDAEDGEASGAGGNGGDPESVVGDVGGCGEVLDAPGSDADKADLDTKWEVATRTAVAMARKRGDLPGHWESIIEKRKTPTQDWRAVLREYINAGARNIQTFNRPNRRFAHTGMILPGNQRDGINKIVFIVDASGSMHGQHVKIANELQAAMDDGAVSETVIIYCDTEVYHVDRFTNDDRIELAPIRLGGTDMRPAFKLVEEEESDANLIICLTDLAIGDPGPEPAQPTLFCAYGDPRSIKMWGDTLPAWCNVLDVDQEVYA